MFSEVEISSVCRTCLKCDFTAIDIQKPISEDSTISIRDSFNGFLNVNLSLDSRFPTQICSDCFRNIVNVHAFYETCIAAEAFWDKSFANSEEDQRIQKDNYHETEESRSCESQDYFKENYKESKIDDSGDENESMGSLVSVESKKINVENFEEFLEILPMKSYAVPEEPDGDSECNSNRNVFFKTILNALEESEEGDCSVRSAKNAENFEFEYEQIIKDEEEVLNMLNEERETESDKVHHMQTEGPDGARDVGITFHSMLDEKAEKNQKKNMGKPDAKFQCFICDMKSVSLKMLSTHQKRQHSDYVGTCVCVICDAVFSSIEQERLHLLKHFHEHEKAGKMVKKKKPQIRAGAQFQCFLCEVKSVSIQALYWHLKKTHRLHCGESPCVVCSDVFESVAQLRTHLSQLHIPKQWNLMCEYCSRVFRDRAHLKTHLMTHTGEKHYSCSYCARAFAQSSALQTHIRALHEGKNILCMLCDKTFTRNSFLKRHMRRHENVRPFECDLCEKSYFASSHLKDHIAHKHNNNKPFSCKVCGKEFKFRKSWNSHKYSHTEKPFECSQCLKRFTTQYILRDHLANVHNSFEESRMTNIEQLDGELHEEFLSI